MQPDYGPPAQKEAQLMTHFSFCIETDETTAYLDLEGEKKQHSRTTQVHS